MNKLTLEVYGQEGCQPCKALKQKLEQDGYNVMYYDISKDQDAKDFIISRGYRSVPVVFEDGMDVTVKYKP